MGPNPFIVRKNITSPRYFHDRREVVSRVVSSLTSTHPQNLEILGQRRIGKTFLLQFLALCGQSSPSAEIRLPSDITLAYWDVSIREPKSPDEFYRSLLDLVRGKLPRELRDMLPRPSSTDNIDEVVDFSISMLEEAQHHVVLLLDEFPLITRNRVYPIEFYSRLRSLLGHQSLALIVASHRPLKELCHREIAGSPFFNVFSTVRLKLGDLNDVTEFLKVPFAECDVTLREDALHEALLLTGGHPALLATLGAALWTHVSPGETLTAEPVSRYQSELSSQFEYDFAYYWEQLSVENRRVALSISFGGTDNGQPHRSTPEVNHLVDNSLVRWELDEGGIPRPILFCLPFKEYVAHHSSEEYDLTQEFINPTEYFASQPKILRARLEHEPDIPKPWRDEVDDAITMLLEFPDHPERVCDVCGRSLLGKLLETIAVVDRMTLEKGLGSEARFVELLRERLPRSGRPPKGVTKPFDRISFHILEYLKAIGDAGAHAREHRPSLEDATECVSVAISLCHRLIKNGYRP